MQILNMKRLTTNASLQRFKSQVPVLPKIVICVGFFFAASYFVVAMLSANRLNIKYNSLIQLVIAGRQDTLSEIVAAGWKCGQKSVRVNNAFKSDENRRKRKGLNETDFKVPNVVHYVWLGSDLKFTFIQYLSFLSVHRYIVPSYIFVYGETGPTGYWWNRTVHDVDNIFHVERIAQTHAPSGKTFRFKAHESDLLRTQVIYGQ